MRAPIEPDSIDLPDSALPIQRDAPEQEGLEFGVPPEEAPPANHSEGRGKKYAFALGGDPEELTRDLNAGNEEILRKRASLDEALQASDLRKVLAQELVENAAAEGREVDPVQMSALIKTPDSEIAELANGHVNIFEKKYAQRVMDITSTHHESSFVEKAVQEEPDKTFFVKKSFEEIIERRSLLDRLAEDTEHLAGDQSWIGWGVDQVKNISPGYMWWKLGNLAELNNSKWFAGSDMQQTVKEIYRLPPREMYLKAKQITDALAEDNPSLAHHFAQAMLGYTQRDSIYDSILISGVDLLSLGTSGVVLRGGKASAKAAVEAAEEVAKVGPARAAKRAKTKTQKAAKDNVTKAAETMRDVAKAMSRKDAGLEDALDAVGDVVEAGTSAATKELAMRARGGQIDSFKRMMNNTPSLFNVSEIMSNGGRYFSRRSAQKLERLLQTRSDNLVKTVLLDTIRSGRIDEVGIKAATQALKTMTQRELKGHENAVLDVVVRPLDDQLGNTTFADVVIANRDGELFDSEAQAIQTALFEYGFAPKSFDVQTKGDKYFINIERALDETSPEFRQAVSGIATRNPTPIGNRIAQALTKVRTPDDLLPKDIVEAFAHSVYGQANLKQGIQNFIESMPRLGKDEADNLLAFMNRQQQELSRKYPDSDAIGNTSENLFEFGLDYYSMFGKAPSEELTENYFALKQLNDIMYAGANISLYMQKSRAGISNFKVAGFLEDSFEGKIVDSIDFDNPVGFQIAVMKPDPDGKIAPELVYSKAAKFPKTQTKGEEVAGVPKEPSPLQEIKKLLKDGYQIVQVSPHVSRELAEQAAYADKGMVRYVVAHRPEKSNLGWDQVNYSEGFRHIPPKDAVYLRQPITNVDGRSKEIVYHGDKTLYQFASQKDADILVPKFEEARRLFMEAVNKTKVGPPDLRAVKAYVRDNLPGLTSKNIISQFQRGLKKNSDEGIDPRIPLMSSKVNQTLDQADVALDRVMQGVHGAGLKFRRAADDKLDIYGGTVNLSATGQRGQGIYKIGNKGSQDNPLWRIERGDIIDPMDALNQGVRQLAQGNFTDDLIFQTSERFIAEFGDVIRIDDFKLYKDPMQALFDPSIFKNNLRGEQLVRLSAAKAYQERVRNFIGVRSEGSKWFGYHVDKLLGDIDERFGQTWFHQSADWLLRKKDPVVRLRQMAFHNKIGLLNPRQLILQPMTMFSMAATIGNTGVLGRVGHALWHMGLVTERNMPELLPSIEKQLRKSGWEKGWFSEAHDLLQRSGYDVVNQTHVNLGDHMDFDITRNGLERTLDYSTVFFRKGERMVRNASMMGAYLEWRTLNKTAKLTDAARLQILKRADLLNMNMSHASRAYWQEGLKSIPTQFYGYPIRMMEQMMGKRLTGREKARILAVHSSVFGVPVALGGAVGVLPTHEIISESLIEQGYDANANTVATVVNDGLLGAITEFATGEPSNISERLGPTGIPDLYNILFKDQPTMETISGASGSTFFNLAGDIAPVVPWLIDVVNPSTPVPNFSPKAVADALLGQVSTYTNAEKAAIILNTGAYHSKSGVKLKETDNTWSAAFQTMLGVGPKEIDVERRLNNIMRGHRDAQRKLRKPIRESIRQILEAGNLTDAKEIATRLKYMQIGGGFTERQMQTMIKEVQGGKSKVDLTYDRAATMDPDNEFVKDRIKMREELDNVRALTEGF